MSVHWSTPWFDGNVRPARYGVYERATAGDYRFSLWDGYEWRLSGNTPEAAELAASISEDPAQEIQWRGRTKGSL